MPQSTLGLHHLRRKQGNKLKKSFDKLIYFMGIVVPIFTIPQAAQIWLNQTAAGVSPVTWSVYLINTIIWTVYGTIQKEKPIIFTFSFMTLINIIIVAGIIVFR